MATLLGGTSVTGTLAVEGAGTGQGLMPVGTVMAVASGLTGAMSLPSAGAVDADGWMICDGSAIPSSQTLSGTLPDLTDGRFLRGNTHANVGVEAGADTHPMVIANYPAHTHTGPAHTHDGPSHTHTAAAHTHTGPDHSHTGPNHSHTFSENRNYGQNINTNVGNHSHQFGYIRSMQGPQAQFIMMDGGGNPGVNSSGNGSHGHNFNVGQNINIGGGTNNSGTGNFSNAGTSATGASGTGATGSAGGDATGADGTGATGSYGAGSVTAIPTLPKYLHVVFVMRVI